MEIEKNKNDIKYENVNRFVLLEGDYDTDDSTDNDKEAYDSTAPNSLKKAVSMYMGIMWPNAQRTVKLNLVDKIPKIKENIDWIARSNKTLTKALDSPEVGYNLSLETHVSNNLAFGPGATFLSEDEDTDFKFTSWGINNIYFEEGRHGFINVIYYKDTWTAERIVDTYGINKVSAKVNEAYKNGRTSDKFAIIQAIEPVKGAKKKDAFKFESVHFEMDGKSFLKKAKFYERPVTVSRFYKDSDSPYGKSPSIITMATIIEINRKIQLREIILENEARPALKYDVNAIAGDEIDSSPDGMTPINPILGSTSEPISRLLPSININSIENEVLRLKESINEAFSLDRLLDFNNQTQMTAYETSKRSEIRGQGNTSVFSRYIAEKFTPEIKRAFAIQFRKGRYGVVKDSDEYNIALEKGEEPELIPDDIAALIVKGEDFYEIEYNSPAASMQSAEELNSIIQLFMQARGLAELDPNVLHLLNTDEALRLIRKNLAAPQSILRAEDEVKKIREAIAQQAQADLERTNQSNDLTLQKQMQEAQNAGQQ